MRKLCHFSLYYFIYYLWKQFTNEFMVLNCRLVNSVNDGAKLEASEQ